MEYGYNWPRTNESMDMLQIDFKLTELIIRTSTKWNYKVGRDVHPSNL